MRSRRSDAGSPTRRDFLAVAATVAAGLSAKAGSLASVRLLDGLLVPHASASITAQTLPLDRLSVVSVAASDKAHWYGHAPTKLKRYTESDWRYSGAGILWRALAALAHDGDPISYLRTLVRPGGTVLIKPNWVEWQYWYRAKITHPTMVFTMAAMAAEAVGPTGTVLIGEGTADAAHWPIILRQTGSSRIAAAQRANNLRVRLVDLNSRSGGWLMLNLGRFSRFAGSNLAYYDGHNRAMGRMGDGRVGRYLLSGHVARADLIIDMAKAKVHCSAGVTLSLKNFVGIVPANDGPYDDWRTKDVAHFSSVERKRGRGGTLINNRTIGKSMADLHALARYVARDGSVQRRSKRKVLSIVDGVLSGELSQFAPRPVRTGWVVAGTDPVAVDHVATRCMGFDPTRVLSLAPAKHSTLPIGTGDPRRIAILYHGPGSFQSYFSPRRKLVAEQVKVRWGDRIDLPRFTTGAVTARRLAGDRCEVRGRADLAVVRLEWESGGHTYVQALESAGPGVWRGSLPKEAWRLRVVAIDPHFNLKVVRL